MILPGFYGKIPATGDFVSRRLTGDFVRVWDRWLAQHLVPLIGLESWP
ncbi:type VI secretion system-associated protein TagF, partial [Mesorhizobium sp. M4B.F.Ca.ET.013.02.1.1]